MRLDEIAVATLMAISNFLNISAVPEKTSPHWESANTWTRSSDPKVLEYSAKSPTLAAACQKNPDKFVEFPQVIHGAHEVYLDDTLVYTFGEKTFTRIRSFYGSFSVPCTLLSNGKDISWNAYSYTQYFARIQFYPRIVDEPPRDNFFHETLNIVAAGALLILAVFTFIIFFKKVSNALTASISLSNLIIAGYFLCNTGGFFAIDADMLSLHKYADICLWVGISFFMYTFYLKKLIKRYMLNMCFVFTGIGVAIIIFGTTGDIVQFGTTIPFGFVLASMTLALVHSFQNMKRMNYRRDHILQVVSLFNFVVCSYNDTFLVLGINPGQPLLAIGYVFGLLFLSLGTNEEILEAYRERNFLRDNLEQEVERKTRELRNKTEELEDAMHQLKSTQSELIQSEKLASLGTLSAGIAHEINNSLNYVNGAIMPLEALIKKADQPSAQEKMKKLFGVMKEGLQLTFQIINSLRRYTGLNQAKFNDINLAEVFESVLTMLRSKIRDGIQPEVDVPKDLTVFGSVVGLNQVFMNIIVNAIDAMNGNGVLRISASEKEDKVVIKIKDSGAGMPPEVIKRVFEPFFTTKTVGKGTGLGLHIVKKEIDRHNGSIFIDSQPNEGTEFVLTLPKSGTVEQDSTDDPSNPAIERMAA